MKIIILKNIDKVGRQGEIKEVSVGYARNYLIPRGLADFATPELIAQLKKTKLRKEREAEKDLKMVEIMAGNLDGREFEIAAKASESGSLYAAVGAEKIVEILKKNNFSISKENIVSEPIKTIGEHEVRLRFAHGLEISITFLVTSAK